MTRLSVAGTLIAWSMILTPSGVAPQGTAGEQIFHYERMGPDMWVDSVQPNDEVVETRLANYKERVEAADASFFVGGWEWRCLQLGQREVEVRYHNTRTGDPHVIFERISCGEPVPRNGGGCFVSGSLWGRANLQPGVQSTHSYGVGGSARGPTAVVGGGSTGMGSVTVIDTSTSPCGDGDLDLGIGGGAFGWGVWAHDVDCGRAFNVHGPNVAVNDAVFGSTVGFVVGEDDQDGPLRIVDATAGTVVCETSGTITPCPDNDPSRCGPADDPDDCLSVRFIGTGFTCGMGGGDGLYWVFLDGPTVGEGGGVGTGATAGTLTAF